MTDVDLEIFSVQFLVFEKNEQWEIYLCIQEKLLKKICLFSKKS